MPGWALLLVSIGIVAVVYAAFVIALVLAGRRGESRAFATFISDCIVLVARLARDERVPRRRKLLLLALVGYSRCRSTSPPTSFQSRGNLTTRSSSRWCFAALYVPAMA
jgi:hypothetical protein